MNSSAINQFLTTGQQPPTAREKSALLDQCRNQMLSTNNQTKPMTSTSQLQKEFFAWKRTNPNGTAAQFTAWKTSGGKPASAAIAAHCGALDPNNLPRLDNGKVDSLAVTNAQNRAKAAELAKASKAVSTKRPPGKIVINRSRYHQPD